MKPDCYLFQTLPPSFSPINKKFSSTHKFGLPHQPHLLILTQRKIRWRSLKPKPLPPPIASAIHANAILASARRIIKIWPSLLLPCSRNNVFLGACSRYLVMKIWTGFLLNPSTVLYARLPESSFLTLQFLDIWHRNPNKMHQWHKYRVFIFSISSRVAFRASCRHALYPSLSNIHWRLHYKNVILYQFISTISEMKSVFTWG